MPYIPRAFCADCAVEMTMEKGGVIVETIANGRGYYKIMADRHECRLCGHSILIGMPTQTLTDHYRANYNKVEADIVVRFADHGRTRERLT